MAATITLPDEIQRVADARAAEAGYSDLSQYLGALIIADAGEGVSPELESRLLEALNTPLVEVRPADWDARRERLANAHGKGSAT